MINHKFKDIICERCKKPIVRDKDRWVNIRDFNKDEVTGEVNLHLKCWKAREKLRKKNFMKDTQKMLKGLLPEIVSNVKKNMTSKDEDINKEYVVEGGYM